MTIPTCTICGIEVNRNVNEISGVCMRISPLAIISLLCGLLLCAPLAAQQVAVHDPVMAKEGKTYYLFSTGPGITIYSSKDMKNWQRSGRVFATEPDI